MATYVPAKINTALIVYVDLVSQANTKLFQVAPTIAAGDFKVSIDGGAYANLATLPVVTPAAGSTVKISLSAAEMNGDNIHVQCRDAAGAEWCDLSFNIQTAARQVDDLAWPTTTGRSIDVDASGGVEVGAIQAGVITAAHFATEAEPGQGTPAASLSPLTKLAYLFKAWRNRSTQTATAYKLYNDDAITVDQKATTSDDGATYDKSEIAAGP